MKPQLLKRTRVDDRWINQILAEAADTGGWAELADPAIVVGITKYKTCPGEQPIYFGLGHYWESHQYDKRTQTNHYLRQQRVATKAKEAAARQAARLQESARLLAQRQLKQQQDQAFAAALQQQLREVAAARLQAHLQEIGTLSAAADQMLRAHDYPQYQSDRGWMPIVRAAPSVSSWPPWPVLKGIIKSKGGK